MSDSDTDAAEYWRLPGPRDYLADVDRALQSDGWMQQVLLVVPEQPGPPGLFDQVAARPSPRRLVRVRLDPDGEDCVVAHCLRAAGHPLPDRVPGVQDLIRADLAHHLLLVEATSATRAQMEELQSVVSAAAALAHNARPEQMPVQVVAIVPGRHMRIASGTPRLTVLYWWGRLSRLDTALWLRQAGPSGTDATRQAAISEVAGFDLDLALHLQTAWDGEADTLCGTVLDYAGDRPELLDTGPTAGTAPTDRPSTELLGPWSSGACDRWNGEEVTWHAAAIAKHEPERLIRALWRAQAMTLLPLLDQQRERVLAWLDRQGHGQRLRQEIGTDLVEIGDLWFYMRHRAGMAGRPQMPLVDWLREARNDVAHLRCISDARLREGIALMSETAL